MDRHENLQKDRLARLRNIRSILGQPDLLTILKVTTINSFLSHKKIAEKQQKFIFGLNFPTTAHFSSYMTNRLSSNKKQAKSQQVYKIKFFMFDIFNRIDFHIEINIPGSLQIKAHNLNGQPINTNNINYQSVYLSSVLRSLFPYYYHPCTQIYGQVQKYQVLQDFIRSFVPFVLKNELQSQQLVEVDNIGIQLLIYYLTQNNFYNLSNILVYQLSKISYQKSLCFSLMIKQLKNQHKQIVLQCAQHLMKQNLSLELSSKLKQFQVRALCKMRKKTQAKVLAEGLIQEGLDDLQTWQEILKMWFQQEDADKEYFRMLNTAINFSADDALLKKKIQNLIYPKKLTHNKQSQTKLTNPSQISKYPQYLIRFDYYFMQNIANLTYLHQSIQKSQKQKSTSQLLHRLNISYQKQSFFQKFVTLYQKQRGWARLIQVRSQCFWLENDFISYQNSMKKKASQMSYRFMNQSMVEQKDKNKWAVEKDSEKQKQKIARLKQKFGQSDQQQQKNQANQKSFQGQFSDNQSAHQSEIHQVAPCSKRVATKRVSRQLLNKKPQVIKLICNFNFQKKFVVSYNDIKLNSDIQKWSSKLELTNINQLTKQKKDLLAYIFLKKGFFHKNMLRYRKSQQAYKIARKCSNDTSIQLISSYCLAKLYLEHNNIKGVQYYTVQIVKILFGLGIQKFEVVPHWAKQIIPYIIKNYGKAITKRLQGPLKQIVQLWLRIDNKSIK